MSAKFVTAEGRLSFPHLLKPWAFSEGDEAKYMCNLILSPGPGADQVRDEVKRVFDAYNWGGPKPKKWHDPVKSCAEKSDWDGYEDDGSVFIAAKSKNAPGIVCGPNREPLVVTEDLYQGCYVRLQVEAFCYANQAKGVGFQLYNVWKTRDGDQFGTEKAEDAFADIDAAAHGTNESLI